MATISERLREDVFNTHGEEAADVIDALVAALDELAATVRGECPSLLNEDSGGSARLDFAIDAALALARGESTVAS